MLTKADAGHQTYAYIWNKLTPNDRYLIFQMGTTKKNYPFSKELDELNRSAIKIEWRRKKMLLLIDGLKTKFNSPVCFHSMRSWTLQRRNCALPRTAEWIYSIFINEFHCESNLRAFHLRTSIGSIWKSVTNDFPLSIYLYLSLSLCPLFVHIFYFRFNFLRSHSLSLSRAHLPVGCCRFAVLSTAIARISM